MDDDASNPPPAPRHGVSGISKYDWLAQIRPRSWWRRTLNLCRRGHRHKWEPVEYADFRCGYCGARR